MDRWNILISHYDSRSRRFILDVQTKVWTPWLWAIITKIYFSVNRLSLGASIFNKTINKIDNNTMNEVLIIKNQLYENLDKNCIVILPPMDVNDSINLLKSTGLEVTVTMLDPWYNRGIGRSPRFILDVQDKSLRRTGFATPSETFSHRSKAANF
jgi:hypothetical protein